MSYHGRNLIKFRTHCLWTVVVYFTDEKLNQITEVQIFCRREKESGVGWGWVLYSHISSYLKSLHNLTPSQNRSPQVLIHSPVNIIFMCVKNCGVLPSHIICFPCNETEPLEDRCGDNRLSSSVLHTLISVCLGLMPCRLK